MNKTLCVGQLRQWQERSSPNEGDLVLLLGMRCLPPPKQSTSAGPAWDYINLTNGRVDWHYESLILNCSKLVGESDGHR